MSLLEASYNFLEGEKAKVKRRREMERKASIVCCIVSISWGHYGFPLQWAPRCHIPQTRPTGVSCLKSFKFRRTSDLWDSPSLPER